MRTYRGRSGAKLLGCRNLAVSSRNVPPKKTPAADRHGNSFCFRWCEFITLRGAAVVRTGAQANRSMQARAALAHGVSQQAFKHGTGILIAGVITSTSQRGLITALKALGAAERGVEWATFSFG